MKRLLLQSLTEIIQSHTSVNPLVVVHWPTRKTLMLSHEEAWKHEEKDRECWLYKGGFDI